MGDGMEFENRRMMRIMRANTDWWINEKAVVGMNGKTYIGYFTDMGEVHIKEFDAKCSRAVSRDVCLCRLNHDFADEHNSPAVCVTESGKIIVIYTGHNSRGNVGLLRYRTTRRPYDIDSFSEQREIAFPGGVSYAQVFENVEKHQIWLFTRVNGINWSFSYSEDEGETWSKPVMFLRTETVGQTRLYYLNVRKIRTRRDEKEYWFFAIYGHPRSSDHTIRAGLFDAEGKLLHMNGEGTGVSLFDGDSFALSTLEPVYDAPENTSVRLLEVSPTLPYRVGLATFAYKDPENTLYPIAESLTYFMARYDKDTGWTLSDPICKGGEFLAPDMDDGSQTYVGGMACYYGVGLAGCYHPWNYTNTDRVYIARFDGKARVLESYITHDAGKSYLLEETLRSIPDDPEKPAGDQIKIWRPIVPIHAQDNFPVYWHEGTYMAHTGGWHCNVVGYVEYDD